MGKIGPAAAKHEVTIPALIKILEDKENWMRDSAAKVLGKMGPAAREAIPALTEALNDDYASRNAQKALAKIDPGEPLSSYALPVFSIIVIVVGGLILYRKGLVFRRLPIEED